MLIRPTRKAQAREASQTLMPLKRSHAEEYPLVLATEFNYQYRIGDAVWIAYTEGGKAPLLTPVLVTKMISPEGIEDVCEVYGLYLYTTAYVTEHQMDYDGLLPQVAIGDNVWVVSNKIVKVTASRPSSSWKGVPAHVIKDTFGKEQVRSLPPACMSAPLHHGGPSLSRVPLSHF